MRKGLFWIIPDDEDYKLLVYVAVCNENGDVADGQPPYNSKKGNSFSHERTWPLVTESLPSKIRSKAWNFFPRGRVEIANGKATVYYNPEISLTDFQNIVLREFEIEDFPTRFVPDFSKHYESGGRYIFSDEDYVDVRKKILASQTPNIFILGDLRITDNAFYYIFSRMSVETNAGSAPTSYISAKDDGASLDAFNMYRKKHDIFWSLGEIVEMDAVRPKLNIDINRIKSYPHVVQRLEDRLNISSEDLSNPEYQEKIRAKFQGYIDTAIYKLSQPSEGTFNDVYVSNDGTIIMELTSQDIITFWTSKEYEHRTESDVRDVKKLINAIPRRKDGGKAL